MNDPYYTSARFSFTLTCVAVFSLADNLWVHRGHLADIRCLTHGQQSGPQSRFLKSKREVKISKVSCHWLCLHVGEIFLDIIVMPMIWTLECLVSGFQKSWEEQRTPHFHCTQTKRTPSFLLSYSVAFFKSSHLQNEDFSFQFWVTIFKPQKTRDDEMK